MSELSDFLANTTEARYGQGGVKMPAGTAIAQDDVVLCGPNGRMYPAQNTDYAAVPNINATVIANTTVYAGGSTHAIRQSVLQGPTGDIYTTAPYNSGSQGLAVYRYSSAGALLGMVIVGSVTASAPEGFYALDSYNPQLTFLANGNILVVWAAVTPVTGIRHAIVNPALTVIKQATIIERHYAPGLTRTHSVVALQAGGYMVTWQQADAGTGAVLPNQRLAVYDNAGAVVTAPFTIQVWTGASSYVMPSMQLLPNGNVAVAYTSLWSGTIGVFLGIRNPAGGEVLALSLLDAGVNGNSVCELDSFGTTFALSYFNPAVAGQVLRIFSLAGVLQGAHLVIGGLYGGGFYAAQIVNDGVDYWHICTVQVSGTSHTLTKMPPTGVNSINYFPGATAVAGGQPTAMFYDRGFLVVMSTYFSFVFETASLRVVHTLPAFGQLANISMIPVGDFTFLGACSDTTTPTTFFGVRKYANTAVVGVAKAGYAQGAYADLQPNPGAYGTNVLKGTAIKVFDHATGANIPGNKGLLLTAGAVLKGM